MQAAKFHCTTRHCTGTGTGRHHMPFTMPGCLPLQKRAHAAGKRRAGQLKRLTHRSRRYVRGCRACFDTADPRQAALALHPTLLHGPQYQECLQAMDSVGAGGTGVTPTQQAARQRCKEVAQDFQKSFRAARVCAWLVTPCLAWLWCHTCMACLSLQGQLQLALDTQELLHGYVVATGLELTR